MKFSKWIKLKEEGESAPSGDSGPAPSGDGDGSGPAPDSASTTTSDVAKVPMRLGSCGGFCMPYCSCGYKKKKRRKKKK